MLVLIFGVEETFKIVIAAKAPSSRSHSPPDAVKGIRAAISTWRVCIGCLLQLLGRVILPATVPR